MQSDKSLIERMFPTFLCLLCRDSDDRHQKTNLIRMMKETNIQSQVTSTIAGDDGEAMAKSEGYVAENGFVARKRDRETSRCRLVCGCRQSELREENS